MAIYLFTCLVFCFHFGKLTPAPHKHLLCSDLLPFTSKCRLNNFQSPPMADFINFICSLDPIFWMVSPCMVNKIYYVVRQMFLDFIQPFVHLPLFVYSQFGRHIALNKATTCSHFYSIVPSVSLFSVLHVLHAFVCSHVTLRALEVLQNSKRLLRTFKCCNVKQRSV